jgi:hypothetical protein
MYSPALGRFLSPDTIVPAPGDPQSLNRYAYTLNNPLKYTDPTGHMQQCPDCGGSTTPVVILDPNRVNPDDQRRALFAWYDAHPEYSPADDPVLNGQSRAQPMDLMITQALLTLEYGLWQMDRGDASGVDKLGAGLVGVVVLLGPGASGGGQGENGGPAVDQKVYRVWGSEPSSNVPGSGPWGRSWSPVDPSSVSNYRDVAGLPTGGTSGAYNRGRFVSEGVIDDTTGVQLRSALSLDGSAGGLTEYIVPNPQQQIRLLGVYGVNPPY